LVGGTLPGGYVYPSPGVKYGRTVGNKSGGNGLYGDRVGISPGYLVGGTFPGGYVYPGPGVKYGVIVGKRPGGNGLNGDKVGSFPGAKVCPGY
jgi:hypothetical protein